METHTLERCSRWTSVTAVAMALVFAGCGGAMDGDDEVSVDHETTETNFEENSRSIDERVGDSSDFVDDSDLLSYGYQTLSATDCDDSSGSNSTDDTGADCKSMGDFEIRKNIKQAASRVRSILQKQVLKKDNIVDQTDTATTYAVEGEDVCQETYEVCRPGPNGTETCTEEQNPNYTQCKQDVDAMEIRLRVESPASKTLQFAVLVGPNQYRPFTFTLGEVRLAGTADFGEIKQTLKRYGSVSNSTVADNLPKTMTGRIGAELRSDRPKHAHFEVNIESSIDISDGDYGLSLQQVPTPVFETTVDGRSKTLTTAWNFDRIEANWVIEHLESTMSSDSDSSDLPETKTLSYAMNLAGLSGESTFEAGDEKIEVTNIGFGDETSWLKIDGNKAVTVDLNPNDGRSFGLTVGADKKSDGSVEALTFDVEPAFDLALTFDFSGVSDWVDVPSWMETYAFDAVLDGGTPASVRKNERHLKVTAGQLELSSTNPTAKHTVATGECLEYVDPESSTCDPDDESCDSGEPYHPLRDLEVTNCSGS